MSCLAVHDLSLCGTCQLCRQPHSWLRPCGRQTAGGSFSTGQKRFSQPQTVPGAYCIATAADSPKQQAKSLKPGLPDISELSPQLQQEWHTDNDALLGGIKVKPGSNRRVLWSCPNCPAGYTHIWQANVTSRTRGNSCPYCAGRTVCQHSSLATKAPSQLKYWNHDKNAKTPEQTLAGSVLRAEWKCPICSHEWQAKVATRVRDDHGCPRCSRISCVGNANSQPTFEAVQHPLLLDWDYERNAANGIHPHDTTLGSRKLVHWICHNCPQGQLHLYQKTPNKRTQKRSSGCPYCAGTRACDCNSLQTHYPKVSSEWDFARNDLTPAQVTSRSDKLVRWENAVRGSWVQKISDRTNPRCNPK